jgi:hypothetical protein
LLPEADRRADLERRCRETLARFFASFREGAPHEWAFIQRHVDESQRFPLMAAFVWLSEARAAVINDWITAPVARWRAMPDDLMFPTALVSALYADDGRLLVLGHSACGNRRCGLALPVAFKDENDEGEPTPLFDLCPACGAPTSEAAVHRPDSNDGMES